WKTRSDRPKLWRRAYSEIRRSKADLLHFHDPELAILLLPYAAFGRRKLVYDIHEHPTGGYARRHWIPGLLRGPVGKLFPKFICNTPHFFDAVLLAEDGYQHLFPSLPNVHLIRNYALIPDPDIPYVDRFSGFDSRRELRLMYFGQLLVQRGALKMVEMVHHLAPIFPNLSLDLVGGWLPPSLGDELKRAVQDSAGRIRLHGYLDYKDADALLRRAHLGLIPLLPDPNHEGSMATKFYDYMIHGLPFVASDLPHWRPFVEQNPAGICADPTDARSFAQVIAQLAQSPEKLRDLSRNGYHLVREKFRWDFEGDRLLQIYRDLS
ncbi:MAG TPA: glycosyltransferase family 4 protein, partial [bacterium]